MIQPVPSRRQRAIDALKDRRSGEVVPYSELMQLIGVADTKNVQSAVNAAKYRLSIDYLKAVESVPGVGYRIVPEAERVRLAKSDQHRAQSALKRGRRQAIYVDVRALTESEKALLEATAQSLAMQLDFARRLDVRKESIQHALEAVTSADKPVRTQTEIDRLRARLAALGDKPPEPDPAPDFDEDAEERA